jgi:aconitate hydratase
MGRSSSGSLGIVTNLGGRFKTVRYHDLGRLGKALGWDISRMPVSLKVILESIARNVDGRLIKEEDLERMAAWNAGAGARRESGAARREIPFMPARVLMQDFTGVPAIVDLAAMRDAFSAMGGNPDKINPLIPVDLVIDHSVQVDRCATSRAAAFNAEMEFERNRERYEFLRWGAESFRNLTVVPPATGICHQVNLEYLAKVVLTKKIDGKLCAFPDTLVGTDSHTTMIDGVGVLGWGVGGIEAEAVMLGQPYFMLLPDVIGFKLTGSLPRGTTPTDIVLRVTEMLRKYGVVDKLVEFFGPGVGSMSVADRALVSNMSPEMGATALYFPVDGQTLAYLRETGRPPELVALVETYTKSQGLFKEEGGTAPLFSDVIELDLGSVETSIAGPKRPHDRVPLREAHASIPRVLAAAKREPREVRVLLEGRDVALADGSVVIAAITSCTNTSNPTVMFGAGILARKAVRLGLQVPAHVKTSFAPGSRVVTRYLDEARLTPYLEALGFHLVGYGCTTCIGNSGPLRPAISAAINENGLTVAAVLSGNRNFEGRIHADVRANYLMSPVLVVAYALAGTMNVDMEKDPLGFDRNGEPVYLRDIWPSEEEVGEAMGALDPRMFREEYANVYTGNDTWNRVAVAKDRLYRWRGDSTYIRNPPFFEGIAKGPSRERSAAPPIEGARVLAVFGDSITTDHISPAGSIPASSPAGKWLVAQGVEKGDFNSYGSRRGNHEVMMRGTFANIRIRNALVPGTEGGVTRLLVSGAEGTKAGARSGETAAAYGGAGDAAAARTVMPIYDAAVEYARRGVPLVVIAGKEYGAGSSRDWAAKGTVLLGVRAVIAESFERIHRSNLIGMGVLPLQFAEGENAAALGLTGEEVFDVEALTTPGQRLAVKAVSGGGREKRFTVRARIDSAVELDYYRNGGILHAVLTQRAEVST